MRRRRNGYRSSAANLQHPSVVLIALSRLSYLNVAANSFLGLAKIKNIFSLHATSSFSSYASLTYDHKHQFREKKKNSCVIRKCCSSFREEEKADVFLKLQFFLLFAHVRLGCVPFKW